MVRSKPVAKRHRKALINMNENCPVKALKAAIGCTPYCIISRYSMLRSGLRLYCREKRTASKIKQRGTLHYSY